MKTPKLTSQEKAIEKALLEGKYTPVSDNEFMAIVEKEKFSGLRKCRIGDYRIIFSIIENTVLITRVGHRKEVYKR